VSDPKNVGSVRDGATVNRPYIPSRGCNPVNVDDDGPCGVSGGWGCEILEALVLKLLLDHLTRHAAVSVWLMSMMTGLAG
jgi:hypothetical protein